jgi:hypothetical protein
MPGTYDDYKEIEDEKKNVLDDAVENDDFAEYAYTITSYGADYDVDGLVIKPPGVINAIGLRLRFCGFNADVFQHYFNLPAPVSLVLGTSVMPN